MERGRFVASEFVARYWHLFVNRLAHTLQSDKPGDNGKHYYYRSKDGRRLSGETIRKHMAGQVTIGLYAINPKTQRSKGSRLMLTTRKPWRIC
jgi:hypothetical protein